MERDLVAEFKRFLGVRHGRRVHLPRPDARPSPPRIIAGSHLDVAAVGFEDRCVRRRGLNRPTLAPRKSAKQPAAALSERVATR